MKDNPSIEQMQEHQHKMEKNLQTIQKRSPTLERTYSASASILEPTYDVYEIGEEFYMEIELPGLSEKEVVVDLTAKHIKIKGDLNDVNFTHRHYLIQQRKQGKFNYMFPLPKGATKHDPPHIENGVLYLKFYLEPEDSIEPE